MQATLFGGHRVLAVGRRVPTSSMRARAVAGGSMMTLIETGLLLEPLPSKVTVVRDDLLGTHASPQR